MTMLASTRQPWNRALRTGVARQPNVCVHDALAAALARKPHRTLLADETRQLTNRDLLHTIAARAHTMLSYTGGPDATVALRLENDVELAVTYFACLAAGLRYLPLPRGQETLIARQLEAISPRLFVTAAGGHVTTNVATLELTELIRAEAGSRSPAAGELPQPDPLRPAHVLLTSGTATGTPKAVLTDHVGSMLSHRWRTRLWPYDAARDVVGCNIFGIWDLVPALLSCIPVVMLRDATLRDPLALAVAVLRYGITRLTITPTLLDACLESADAIAAFRHLRLLVLCGEMVTEPLMERIFRRLPGVAVANLYSLSECHDVAAGMLRPGRAISAGVIAPFADVHVVAPDDPAALVPAGEAGRILVGGRALARGYLDAALTAAKFPNVTLGATAPVRVYDTGDLGRLNEDGTLDILGRVDTELKVRGAWADPDAVSALLLEEPWVARAVTIAEPDAAGHAALRAYVVPAPRAPADLQASLRRALSARLPSQNVPSRIELLGDLPLLPSGKIDITRLREGTDEAATTRSRAPSRTPASGLQDTVLAVFRDVLEQPQASVTDSYDDLGGDSLGAIVLCGRIQAATGQLLRVRDLQRHPTPSEIARFLAERPSGTSPEQPPLPLDRLPSAAHPKLRTPQTVFVTGATGTLGCRVLRDLLTNTPLHVVTLVRAADDRHAHTRLESALPDGTPLGKLTAFAGDLTRPRLGLAPDVLDDLTRRIDAVLHLAARVDTFAGYEALAAVNVAGTRSALGLALSAGAVFHHLSSSSVLPLDSDDTWDESRHGSRLMDDLAPRLMQSDGYSQTKLAAEALVWQAAERGLRVAVTRIPHLVDADGKSRLTATVSALRALQCLPEGPWRWQVVDVETVSRLLLQRLQQQAVDAPLRHVAPTPVTDREIEAALSTRGRRLERLTLPAVANRLGEAAPRQGRNNRGASAHVATLDQLSREHGIRAALCLNEPALVSAHRARPNRRRLLLDLLLH